MLDFTGEVKRWNGQQLDTGVTPSGVRLLNAGLDDKGGNIIAQGFLDIESLRVLRVDDYQREVLSGLGKKSSIRSGLEEGIRLSAVVLGMRGQRVQFPKGSSVCLLQDPVYIIDGLQRITNLLFYAEQNPDLTKTLRIGAEVRFDTNKASEKKLFDVLNTKRIPVSPNVILRNLREESPAILTLYGLSKSDKNFALYDRVQWTQRKLRGELVTGLMLANTADRLHRFGGSESGRGSTRAAQLATYLDKISKNVGLTTFRNNIVDFFDIVDACWGIRAIEYSEKATHLKGNILGSIATMFSQHSNFWKPGTNRLFVEMPLKRKLSAFPILDPEVGRLAGAGTMAMRILYDMLINHMNKGKRAGRLMKRTDVE